MFNIWFALTMMSSSLRAMPVDRPPFADCRGNLDEDGDDEDLLAEFRRAHPRAMSSDLAWAAFEVNDLDFVIARPRDEDLADRMSVRVWRDPRTRAWNLSLRVAPPSALAWIDVSFAFEHVQKKRRFDVGFRADPVPGELAKGIVANFSEDAAPGEADVEDGFEVVARVFEALRGRRPSSTLN